MNCNNKNVFNFNHRITLQKEVQETGEYGDIRETFENISNVWAMIKTFNTDLNFNRMKKDMETTHLITIKFFEDAKKCKRILFNSRVFDVLTINCPDENKELLIFSTKEIDTYND